MGYNCHTIMKKYGNHIGVSTYHAFVIIMLLIISIFCSCKKNPSGKCGPNLFWTYNAETEELVITGTGEMTCKYANTPWLYDQEHGVFTKYIIRSISLPEGLTTIGAGVFSGTSITTITIPNTVVDIGDSAFADCDFLKTVQIGKNVKRIGYYAFGLNAEGCNRTIINNANIPQKITEHEFYNYIHSASLYVPRASLLEYKNAEIWKEFGTIEPIE